MKKMVKLVGIIAFIAVIGITFLSCKDETPKEQPKSRMDNQPVSDLSWGGKVTIKSADLYLDADWVNMVADVVTALERGYSKPMDSADWINKTCFETVFAVGQEAKVILSSTTSWNCEVKDNDWRTLYLKSSALGTVDVQPAVWVMTDGIDGDKTYTAKVTPANGKIFEVSNANNFV